MIVFFTSSVSAKPEFQHYYDECISAIRDHGDNVNSLEFQKYEDLIGKEAIRQLSDEEAHYAYTKKGMNIAQAIIIEASRSSFYLGHEVTLGLLLNKPVLCLSSTWDYSKRIKHPKFHACQYQNKNELRKAICDFLDKVRNKYLTVRFNLFLNPDQKNFIDWYAQKHDKTASELIRELIEARKNETPEYLDEMLNLGDVTKKL
jgi:hypothetical protein